MYEMADDERRAFLLQGTRTGKLATVRRDGRPHVVPIWFLLDGDDVVLTTGADTVKGRNIRTPASACASTTKFVRTPTSWSKERWR